MNCPALKNNKDAAHSRSDFFDICSCLSSDMYWKLLPQYFKTAQTPFLAPACREAASTSLWHFGSLKTLLELVGERAAALHFLMKCAANFNIPYRMLTEESFGQVWKVDG